MTGLLLRGADVDGRRVDVRVVGGVIDEVGDGLVRRGEEVVDVGGGAVLPGLHDHHIHLLALAAAAGSVEVGPPGVASVEDLVAALGQAGGAPSLVRAVGYHESVAGDLDRDRLDDLVADRPVRVQHRGGALWVLNSAALAIVGLDDRTATAGEPAGVERNAAGRLTGRFWRVDAWLRDRLPEPGRPDLGAVGEELLRHGVTGLTDATPTEDLASLQLLATSVGRGELVQRVVATGGPGLVWSDLAGVERGPVKLLAPDHEDPSFERMVDGVRAARRQGRPVAVHAVTAATAALAVAAIDEVGPMVGDRIEHGAVLSVPLAARIAEMGIVVVTNPGFVGSRGDQYLTDVDAGEQVDLWRCGSLIDAGVPLGAGTDAPFGDPNPWRAMAAAVDRRTVAGRSLGIDEAVSARVALGLFLGPLEQPGAPNRRVVPGAVADLCVLGVPLDRALSDPGDVRPAMTVVGGDLHAW